MTTTPPRKEIDCSHMDPSSWQHKTKDGVTRAYCRACGKFMGRVDTRKNEDK